MGLTAHQHSNQLAGFPSPTISLCWNEGPAGGGGGRAGGACTMLRSTRKDHPPLRGPVAGVRRILLLSESCSLSLPAESPLVWLLRRARFGSGCCFCCCQGKRKAAGRGRPSLARRTGRKAALAWQSWGIQNASFLSENTLLGRQRLSMAPSLHKPSDCHSVSAPGVCDLGLNFRGNLELNRLHLVISKYEFALFVF